MAKGCDEGETRLCMLEFGSVANRTLSFGPVNIAHAKETRETLDEWRFKNPKFGYFEVAREKRTQPFCENFLSRLNRG
jgi:hypothetical protein